MLARGMKKSPSVAPYLGIWDNCPTDRPVKRLLEKEGGRNAIIDSLSFLTWKTKRINLRGSNKTSSSAVILVVQLSPRVLTDDHGALHLPNSRAYLVQVSEFKALFFPFWIDQSRSKCFVWSVGLARSAIISTFPPPSTRIKLLSIGRDGLRIDRRVSIP